MVALAEARSARAYETAGAIRAALAQLERQARRRKR